MRSLNVQTAGRMAVLALGLAVSPLLAQDTFYYKKGEKVPLQVDASKSYVLLAPETSRAEVEKATEPVAAVLRRFDAVQAPKGLNLNQGPAAERPKWAIIDHNDVTAQPLDQADLATKVLYKAPFFRTQDKKQVGISHLVYVKLKNSGDGDKLKVRAKELKVEVLGNNKQLPLWYTVACSKDSAGNALQVANKLYETGEFADTQPDFLSDFQIKQAGGAAACAADAHFGKQWGLKNTGQNGGTAGVDIGACDAWAVATGKGVKVAVVDHGIQLDHPDLKANLSPLSFDTATGTSPSRVLGSHGTACAGIVAAVRNNDQLGVAGVAPEATLISVSDSLTLGPDAQQNLASGLAWAARNGADVISNSWGHNDLESALIDDAIEMALTTGRGGKGCVVVFAAGNNGKFSPPVIYPARSNSGVLAVGAMSPCGERKSEASCDPETFWASCYGSPLDVVAPGVLIPTTDRTGGDGYDLGDYTLKFNGTSSATPHVAGVAALILQVNPGLTRQQVNTIIESTARKVGPYPYKVTAGRPNGSWHPETGHGMVDAKACVEKAKATLDK